MTQLPVDSSANPFTTSDTSLAAYLHMNQHLFVGIKQDPNDAHRKVYVFVKTEETEELENEYLSGEVTVHPKLYYKSIRIMHKMLREGTNIDESISKSNS
jgi:hypothetical protein